LENIIVNSNFSDANDPNLYNPTYGWIAHNIGTTLYRDNFDNKKYYMSGGERDVFFDLPPGLYQKIDLSNYSYDVKLEIEYKISYYNKIAAQRQNDLITSFYVYEIGSYNTSTKIPVNNVRNYLVREDVKLYYDEVQIERGNDIEEIGQLSITLPPGYYVIGFGSNFIDVAGSGFIADGRELNGLCVEKLSAYALELTTGTINLASSDDFEPWGIESASFATDPNFSCPINLEANDVGIRLAYNDTLEESKNDRCGYMTEFTIPDFNFSEEDEETAKITGRLSFWYHSSLVGSTFAVYIHDADLNKEYLYEDGIEIETNEWTQYVLEFGAWEGRYQLFIIPPEESYKSSYLMLNSIDCSLYVEVEGNGGQGGQGTFENPYNSYDGYIYYWSINRCLFESDTVRFDKIFFVKINGKYYMGNSYMNGGLCINGFYNSSGVKLSSPNSTSDLRYFFEDGTMAIDESFIYEDKVYTANELGICKHTSMKMTHIDLKLKDFDYNINSVIDMPRNISKTIIASFDKQSPPARLTVTSSNEDIVSGYVDILNNGLNTKYDEDGSYNESNTIIVTGHHLGTSTITVSYESFDGTIISNSFDVLVRDTPDYYKNGDSIVSLDFVYDVNYLLRGKSLDLRYILKPNSNLPVDWQIVDNVSAFTLEDGVLTAKDVNYLNASCTVSISNYGSGMTDTCKIYLTQNTTPTGGANYTYKKPVKIVFENAKNKMEAGEILTVKAITQDVNGSSVGVTQNVNWSSNKPSIATVDQTGTIMALNEGTAKITCTCVEDPYAKGEFEIQVVGYIPGVSENTEYVRLQKIELNMQEAVLLCPTPRTSGTGTDFPDGRVSYEYLECSFVPANTQEKNVEWVSDDPSLVMVDQNGRIYPNPDRKFTYGFKGSTYVRCKSKHTSYISAACKVNVRGWSEYEPIVYFSKSSINAYIQDKVTIGYGVSNCSYITYHEDQYNVSVLKDNGDSTSSPLSFTNKTISFTPNEEGTFVLTATCVYDKDDFIKNRAVTGTCYVIATENVGQTPSVSETLELIYALEDGSYCLKYDVGNDINNNFLHRVGIDNDEFKATTASQLIYNGEEHYYIFDKMASPGTYKVRVRVVNGNYSKDTEEITVSIPEITNNETSLERAKFNYDTVCDDIISYLKVLIQDNTISAIENSEFDTRYRFFCIHYDNLKSMLDICINHIDERIKEEQAEMSTMATALTSDGTVVATYSMDEATNSNYKNVTDMDYYQNECIKALVQRVLELEARLNELTNNN
jgi:hypothetical protein